MAMAQGTSSTPAWVSTNSQTSRLSPAWDTIDNEKIKAAPQINGLKSRISTEPQACEDFKSPANASKMARKWTSGLRSTPGGGKEVNSKLAFWTPGIGRGLHADPVGGTRGNREGKRASTANILPQFLPSKSGDQDQANEQRDKVGEKPSPHEVAALFAHLVCEEKQDADAYPKVRNAPKKQYGKEGKQEDAPSPSGKSALSTQPSTPRSPGPGWHRIPFTPRKGETVAWDQFEGDALQQS
mmetsp:Transcript_58534/g.171244  ORF Transcript_58534/g.171244 Transcript_58534/m.171244 type:complete len:241 (-) Transcript_58534:159-881(-)